MTPRAARGAAVAFGVAVAAAPAAGPDASAQTPTPNADAAAPLDLSRYRWRNRVLLLFAPSAEDPAYRAEAAALREDADGLTERDVLVASVFERGGSTLDGRPLRAADAAALRRRYRAPAGRVAAVLVGKDGRTTVRFDRPGVVARLFPAIDAMPMRRAEARRRGS